MGKTEANAGKESNHLVAAGKDGHVFGKIQQTSPRKSLGGTPFRAIMDRIKPFLP